MNLTKIRYDFSDIIDINFSYSNSMNYVNVPKLLPFLFSKFAYIYFTIIYKIIPFIRHSTQFITLTYTHPYITHNTENNAVVWAMGISTWPGLKGLKHFLLQHHEDHFLFRG